MYAEGTWSEKKQQTDQIDGLLELLEETMIKGKLIEPHNTEFLRKFPSAKHRLLVTKRRTETTRARRKRGGMCEEQCRGTERCRKVAAPTGHM